MEEQNVAFSIISLFIITTILNTIIRSLFPKKSGFLYCGIFGGGFNIPINELIMEKLKILGMFNMSRGKDSCGYYNGDVIEKGVYDKKEFFDFVVKNGIKYNNNGNNVFIGHCRNSTVGQNTEENAHPFNVDDMIVLAHNGTLSNHWQLCREYGIPMTNINVDSFALGKLLCKVNYHILKEYEGAAALMIHNLKKSNSLYVYHGFSREFKYSVEAKEERPLYWMKAPYGVFVSSMKDSLQFIKGEGYSEPEVVPHNCIMEIRNGVIIKKAVATVDRSEIFKPEPAPVKTLPPMTSFHRPSETNSRIRQTIPIYSEAKINIMYENEPSCKTFSETKIHFHQGRYKDREGNLLDGAFIITNKSGEIVPEGVAAPDNIRISKKYFYKGVMLKGYVDWKKIQDALTEKSGELYHLIKGGELHNFAKNISVYALYPVTNMPGDCNKNLMIEPFEWYKNGKRVPDSAMTPVFSTDRNYHFKNGYLKSIVSNTSSDKVEIHDPTKKKVESEDERKLSLTYTNEVIEIGKKFEVCYGDIKELNAALGKNGLDALEFYFEAVLNEILDTQYDNRVIQALIVEITNEAVERMLPLKALLDPSLQEIEYYITDAVGAIDGEEVEDIVADPFAATEYGTMDRIDEMFGLTEHQKIHIDRRTASIKKKFERGAKYSEAKQLGFPGILDEITPDNGVQLAKKYNALAQEETWEVLDKTFENELAMDKLNNVLSKMEDLLELSHEFDELQNSTIAKNVSWDIKNAISNMGNALIDSFTREGASTSVAKIKLLMKDIETV